MATGVCAMLLSTSALGHAQSAGAVEGPSGAVNFGAINVCPAGQTSPMPCSRTRRVHYNVTATTTFGNTKVVTQGEPNLDFTLSATTCKGTLQAGSFCTVSATFAPLAAGARTGAVQLTDSSGNLLMTTYIYGSGQGAIPAFTPSPQITLPVTGQTGFDSLAVDAAGNIFFDVDGGIAKFDPRIGVQTTVASGVSIAFGLAVDGAGNIFFSGCSNGNPSCGTVEIATGTGVQTLVGEGLMYDFGVAVDARENIFIIDSGAPDGYPRLVEIHNATGRQATLLGGQDPSLGQGYPLLNNPSGVAVDGADDVFVACFNYGPVFELTARHALEEPGDFGAPYTLATDAAGDLYVNDIGWIGEVAAGTGIETDVNYYNLGEGGIATDAGGNLFLEEGYGLVEVNSAEPPTFDFGSVAVGSTSSPQSLTLQNVGTLPLNAVPPGLAIGAGFLQVPGSGTPPDCTSSFSLAPGATCNLSIVFAPQVVGTIKGTATFTDDALNRSPSAGQIVKLKGTGIQ